MQHSHLVPFRRVLISEDRARIDHLEDLISYEGFPTKVLPVPSDGQNRYELRAAYREEDRDRIQTALGRLTEDDSGAQVLEDFAEELAGELGLNVIGVLDALHTVTDYSSEDLEYFHVIRRTVDREEGPCTS